MDEYLIKLPQNGPDLPVRYVLLHHTGIAPEHFDLMVLLPGEAKLATWRILTPPEEWQGNPPVAERIADHRIAYLEFEGELSGSRGRVKRVAHGNARLAGTQNGGCRIQFEALEISLLLPTLRLRGEG